MAVENLFRFMSIRGADVKSKVHSRSKKIDLYGSKEGRQNSKLIKAIAKAGEQEISIRELQKILKAFKESENYIKSFDEIDFKIEKIKEWFFENQNKYLKELKINEFLINEFGAEAADLIKKKEFVTSRIKLADTVLANTLDRRGLDEQNEKFLLNLKLFNMLSAVAENSEFTNENFRLAEFVTDYTLLIPDILNIRKLEEEEEEEVLEKDIAYKEPENEDKHTQEKLAELDKAHKEITTKGKRERFRYIPKNTNTDLRIKNLERALSKVSRGKSKSAELNRFASSPTVGADKYIKDFVFSLKAFNDFSPETKKVINSFGLLKTELRPMELANLIERKIEEISSKINVVQKDESIIVLGDAYLNSAKFKSSIGYSKTKDGIPKKILSSCKWQVGIGDLLMVKQKLKAYEVAEFAHIENVLAGEIRKREHRRLNVREEIYREERELETEKERDLQSTERNEIQIEAEKVVKSQFELQAGLQISGSYGPAVSFTASLNTGFSTSTQETQKKASSYSRQITEKSVEKVKEKVREERVRRVLEEIEETNLHEVNNANSSKKHVRGIYRWLNKIYDAQVFNYGQRMMYEFIIPEPAAYFLYAMVENAPSEIEIPKPTPPKFNNRNLRPSDLSRANYSQYVSKYNVVNIPDIPSAYTVVSAFDKQDGNNENNFGRTSKIPIPTGYEAFGATVTWDGIFPQGENWGARIMVGGVNIERTYWGAEYKNFSYDFRGEVAVNLSLMTIRSFAFSVDVFCNLTSEGFAKWQHQMYEAIMDAYLQQKAQYEEKIAALEIQKGVPNLGKNPLENRRLERDELKKLTIMLLSKSPYLYLNSYSSGTAEPFLNIDKSCKEGSYIRFFENAFEWNNLMYVFYPYFWGRHSKWMNALHLSDPDSEFAAFLKAGAARVQIPVRPGFEKAVAHFSQFGEVWQGNDIPLKEDDLYVPIVDEITENLGKIKDAVPYPSDSEPWEVVVPTSLVVLQNLEEIEGIRDSLSGEDINIQPQDS